VRGFGLDRPSIIPTDGSNTSYKDMRRKSEAVRMAFPWGVNPIPQSATSRLSANQYPKDAGEMNQNYHMDEDIPREPGDRREKNLEQNMYQLSDNIQTSIFDQDADYVTISHTSGGIWTQLSKFLVSMFHTNDIVEPSVEESAEMGLLPVNWDSQQNPRVMQRDPTTPLSVSHFPALMQSSTFVIPPPSGDPPPLPPLPQPTPCNFPNI